MASTHGPASRGHRFNRPREINSSSPDWKYRQGSTKPDSTKKKLTAAVPLNGANHHRPISGTGTAPGNNPECVGAKPSSRCHATTQSAAHPRRHSRGSMR